MQLHGFKPYPYEWWHFTLADDPYSGTYFNFPVKWGETRKPNRTLARGLSLVSPGSVVRRIPQNLVGSGG